jgi:hypothetical protein
VDLANGADVANEGLGGRDDEKEEDEEEAEGDDREVVRWMGWRDKVRGLWTVGAACVVRWYGSWRFRS